MFFKNIEKWSTKRLRAVVVICYLFYFLLSLVTPIVVIAIKYDIFAAKENESRLSGVGIIFIIVFSVLMLKALKRVISKLPDITFKQQKLKYSLELIYALIIPLLAVICLHIAKNNFNLAISTTSICVWLFIGAILVESFTIKYLDKEMYLRSKALERIEVDKRVSTLS